VEGAPPFLIRDFFLFFQYILTDRPKMDDTLEQVREKCALQLEMYQKCVENYPHSWDKSCMQQKKALTKCSEEK
jgi:hypothetical protein